jgi:hypothetical protein
LRVTKEPMNTSPTCHDCKIQAPETNTGFSLIGTEGWRINRRQLFGGTVTLEWRCPACWARYRGRQQAAAPLSSAAPGSEEAGRAPPDPASAPERTPSSSKRGPDSRKWRF